MNQDQLEIPIQPVERPILCNPYEEPDAHWVYNTETGEAIQQPGRRDAGYWYKTQRTGSGQLRTLSGRRTGRPTIGECAAGRCQAMAGIKLPKRNQGDAGTAATLGARR